MRWIGKAVFVFVAELWVCLFAEHLGQTSSAEAAWAERVEGSGYTGQCMQMNGGASEARRVAEAGSSKRLVMPVPWEQV